MTTDGPEGSDEFEPLDLSDRRNTAKPGDEVAALSLPATRDIVVLTAEQLGAATVEEREAYYQYLMQEVMVADEWEPWLTMFFPWVASSPFSKGHREFWEWVWSIEAGVRPPPWVSVWPRGHGKSSSTEMALAALAARGRRRYGLYVSESQDQADDHVANVAALLEATSISAGYPQLGERLVGKFGNSKGWRRNRIRTASGFTLDAMGLDSAARGIKLEDQRPDLIVLDDIDSEMDTENATAKKIKIITQKLIPAGSKDCAVLCVQNLVHENSIFARLADGRADFLRDRIVSGPYPAIYDLEYEEREDDDGKRRWVITGGTPSWPEGFDLAANELLMNDMGVTAYLAECQHVTEPPEGDVFSHLSYAHMDWVDLPKLAKAVTWVDPAVTEKDSSDSMGIQIDALGLDGTIYRLFSWEQRSTPYKALQVALAKSLELINAGIPIEAIGVETNQGGDTWQVVYNQVVEDERKRRQNSKREGRDEGDPYFTAPRYKEEKASKALGDKVYRASRMLVDYERFKFVHVRGTHQTLEAALKRFPKVKPYDLVDAAYWSWRYLAGKRDRRRGRAKSAARKQLPTPMGG